MIQWYLRIAGRLRQLHTGRALWDRVSCVMNVGEGNLK